MREKGWSKGAARTATGFAMVFTVAACDDASSVTTPSDAAPLSDIGVAEPFDGSTFSLPEASNDDASQNGDAPIDAAEAGSCSTDAGFVGAGDYLAPDGTQYWLRNSATAATLTIVPGGTPAITSPPHLARIREVCSQWLGVAGTDGTFARVDWASVTGGLLLCERSVLSLDAATALPGANPGDTDGGCSGSPWLSLTPVSQ